MGIRQTKEGEIEYCTSMGGRGEERSVHKVGRVLSFSPVVGIGTPPTPHPQASVPPLPFVPGGGARSLAREGWESPSSDEGKNIVVLFTYMYFVGAVASG